MMTAVPTYLKWCRVFFQFAKAILASGLSAAMKYAVVVRVLAGKGLTAIANVGNPAGEAILALLFPSGIVPLGFLRSQCRLRQSRANAFYVRDDFSGKT